MIRDLIDPPHIIVTSHQTEPLIDPTSIHIWNYMVWRRELSSGFRRKLYSRFSGSSRPDSSVVHKRATGPSPIFLNSFTPPKVFSLYLSWVRKQLRAQDFADLRARRKVPGKTAYTLRIKKLLRSARAQRVAANIALGFKRVCKQVVKNKGAASKA